MIVRLPEDTSYDYSGIPVVNDATVEGTNFADADAQVAVTPIIPLELETTTTKSFDPATGGATRALAVGAPAQYTDMPVGAECAVTETRDGGAHAVRMTPADPADPSTAVVTTAGAAVAVTVDNRFDSALATTGADARAGMLALGTALGLIAIGAAVLVITRRRRTL